ncbi:MAG: heme o synthase [Pseudomonadota bacterium]
MNTDLSATQRSVFGQWRDYLELCKPKVVLLLVFTAIVGMLLSVNGWVPLQEFVFGTLGIGLASASAAAINHLIDHRADAQMARTKNRPLPKGNLNLRQCLIFALAIGVLSMVLLVLWVNVLTAVLTFLSLIGYAVIYTLYLKRATPQNIVIGGAAGAMPPVLGWAAIAGEVTAEPLLLFLIIFTWTPPHFWALAIHRKDDYAKVGIPMLPVTHGEEFTRLQVLLYTILMVVVTILPYLIGMNGWLYLLGAVGLGVAFLVSAIRMMDASRGDQPMKTFVFSINYLMALFAFLLIDHYLSIA